MTGGSRIMLLGFVFLAMGMLTADRAVAAVEPLGWWPLNEGAGDVANDISGNGNNGTIYNVENGGIVPCVCDVDAPAWYTDPDRGMVLSFGGDNSAGAYVDAGMIIPPLTLEQDFTWVFWAKQLNDGTGVNETMLGNRHGASDDLNFSKFTPTNFEVYNHGDNGFIGYEDLPSCEWLAHAVVKDGDTFTYYRHNLNGELIETGSSVATSSLVALPLYMGGDAGGERWSGWLSDVRIFDEALTYDKVRTIVPEPATIALLGLGGMALLRRRRA